MSRLFNNSPLIYTEYFPGLLICILFRSRVSIPLSPLLDLSPAVNLRMANKRPALAQRDPARWPPTYAGQRGRWKAIRCFS